MNSNLTKLIMCLTLVMGAAIWFAMANKFDADEKLSYEPNVASIKGSPYGKIFALAMQGSISFYWHEGRSHQHADLLADDHGHDHDDHHGHGHDDHGHGHDDHHGHGHDDGHGHHADCSDACADHHEHSEHKIVEADIVEKVNVPLVTKAQLSIKQMEAYTRRKTNNAPLTVAHRKHLHGQVEDKLRLAYELDPTNYTNYGNYHLFLFTTSYGKSDGDEKAALSLARRTLSICMQESIDPAPWVTAASAAYNIVSHIGQHHTNYTIAEAKQSLGDFDYCIERHYVVLNRALSEGRLIPESRMKEMRERVNYLSKLRRAQGIYMKRIMSSGMAAN